MPIYAYEPTITSEEQPTNPCCYFETLQKLNEESLKTCPQCGHAVHRAITSFALGGTQGNSPARDGAPSGVFQKSGAGGSNTGAGRVANLVSKHVCGRGCAH